MRTSARHIIRSGEVLATFVRGIVSEALATPGGQVPPALGLFAAIFLSLSAETTSGQTTNQITMVNPSTAVQGTTNLLVTFTLDTDMPPAPPAGVMPTGVMIGSISGTSVTHASQYTVTALFSIAAGESAGSKDATISFMTPNGTLVFSKAGGLAVTSGATIPPSLTQQPQAQTTPAGSSVTFTVAASGTAPLNYQWQRNSSDIRGATGTSYTINPLAVSDAGGYRCVVTNNYGSATSDAAELTVSDLSANGYPIVDTGQIKFYSNTAEITAPASGQAFYGQDAQYIANAPSYTLSADGLTVYDNVTRLTWQRSPDTNGDGSITASDKFNWTNAQTRPAVLNAANYGGYSDWRLPTIKEMYSLIKFNGTDPSGLAGSDTSGLTPFIDTKYFRFAYGDTSAGERIIDSQYVSGTLYVAPDYTGEGGKLFGVNLADGRIKGYGLTVHGTDKTFLVQCVRGNSSYGFNHFVSNGDGTVTDSATGRMWAQSDSGSGMDWESALAWVQTKNAQNYLGHSDWRLPNAKELQSIVDYTRSPDTTGSAAIDPVFACTQITNEDYKTDYPWYWTGSTHASYTGSGTTADYVCFGRALGYMNGTWVDVHGAGCQRSDPKSGSLSNYTHVGNGYYNSVAPQGDAVRIYNYVRPVRDASRVGDINGDGRVDVADLLRLAGCWATSSGNPGFDADCDLSKDGWVNVIDVLILAEDWAG